MGATDKKIEIILHNNEVHGLLRGVAEGFRNVALPDALLGFASDIEHCSKLELSIKVQGGLAEMKLKVKGAGVRGEEPQTDGSKLSYKSLKKRMKTTFKFLEHSLASSMLPPQEIVESFLADSAAMCAHQDRGPQDYAPYAKLCESFRQAYAKKDRETLARLCGEISLSKKACHARGK